MYKMYIYHIVRFQALPHNKVLYQYLISWVIHLYTFIKSKCDLFRNCWVLKSIIGSFQVNCWVFLMAFLMEIYNGGPNIYVYIYIYIYIYFFFFFFFFFSFSFFS